MIKQMFFKALNKIKWKTYIKKYHNKQIANEIMMVKEYRRLEKKYKKSLYRYNSRFQKEEFSQNKTIWYCWLQGIEKAPDLVKVCYESVIKNLSDNYKVQLITFENINEFINIPSHIYDLRKRGIMCDAHFADYIRVKLLYEYGGIWIDATTYISSSNIPSYFKEDFFAFKNVNLDRSDENIAFTCNWLIVADKHNEITYYMCNLLEEVWKKEKVAYNYFFFDLLMKMIFKCYPNLFNEIPTFSPVDSHLLQFEMNNVPSEKRLDEIFNISTIHKLNYKNNTKLWENILSRRIE